MKKPWPRIALSPALISILLITAGCPGPTRNESEFGNSVRNMVAAQKYAPPAAETTGGLDGIKAEKVLKAYREDVSATEGVKNEIQIKVGDRK